MSDIAIRVKNLSKLYHIEVLRHDSLSERIQHGLKGLFHRNGRVNSHRNGQDFWALKDVSFEVNHGEVVGIIGRNGAGKSTLLKILSRITGPTKGRVEIHGRVASLLEVGTGFHPQLTGRDNIYLSGAILGMKKAEIDREFDEIVDFAEIEKFLDTPVKRYSSGMYVRLAFAVAAHLQPEMLIIDEVLAVGDAAFQKKCLGKMDETAKRGRTVLFVSHNMTSIQFLCTRALLLKQGEVAYDGSVPLAIMKYMETVGQVSGQQLDLRTDRNGGEDFCFKCVKFLNPKTMLPLSVLVSGEPAIIRIGYNNRSNRVLDDVGIGIAFYNLPGSLLFSCRSRAIGITHTIPPGEGYTDCRLDRFPLKFGQYSYNLFAERRNIPLDDIRDVCSFYVEASDYYGSGCLPSPGQPGVLVDYGWLPLSNNT